MNQKVKAVAGHFKGKTGTIVRTHGASACVVWDGVWEHGIWVEFTELEIISTDRKLRTLLRWILTDAKPEPIKELAQEIEDSL